MPEVEKESDIDNLPLKEDPVPYDTYRKFLAQRKNDQEKMKQITSKLETYEKKLKDFENNTPPNSDYKSLYETRNKELEELSNKIKEKEFVIGEYENKYARIKKLSAFTEALPAKLKRKEYYAHVDLDQIIVDPDTGDIDQKSIAAYATKFSEDFKDLLDLKGGSNLPNAKSNGTATLSYEQWLQLPASEMKARFKEIKR